MLTGSALILAGGKSSRMGYDKKQLRLGGASVFESLVARLKTAFGEVLVSANEPLALPGVTALRDGIGSGPLAGVYQGLLRCGSDYLYVTACDMPFLSLDYIRHMQELIRRERVDACVARREDGRYEPFNSFFGKSCIPPLREALLRGEYKISLLLDRIHTHIVGAEAAKQFGDADMFFNINYAADLAEAARRGRSALPLRRESAKHTR
ncbi:molybdenum cofactor guanylyltransferase [Treponema endosymbiont of Eucomonympha sp.]|uniref:molybdenum cofactor guanylyltransferase n=1 Tax=Treponema endosymbiont of Eucomonympha sp. TaxID=1580831 RepID=UPI000ACF46A2|nr:molybdenum cofactor guanylyltransferase [Treponema endosymbiont of Eucomonympha sp.]